MPRPKSPRRTTSIVAQLGRVERDGGDGSLVFAGGATLSVTNLDKLFFPEAGLTKGDVMRYYVRTAPALLPTVDGRPLALKRYPHGVAGHSFFQHDPGRGAPAATRIAPVPTERGGEESRYVGGDLLTLLETVQLGAVTVNAWHSRVETLDHPDYSVLDLDPGPEAPFARVVEVALWVRAELDALGLEHALKTSGSTGLHILVPLPPRITYEAAAQLAEWVAGRVAQAHPAEATVERALGARSPAQVYVDHMQNARGKTLASVYSVRARAQATVSAPLTWRQVTRPGFDPAAFTLATVPSRLARLDAVWRASTQRVNAGPAVERALARFSGR